MSAHTGAARAGASQCKTRKPSACYSTPYPVGSACSLYASGTKCRKVEERVRVPDLFFKPKGARGPLAVYTTQKGGLAIKDPAYRGQSRYISVSKTAKAFYYGTKGRVGPGGLRKMA